MKVPTGKINNITGALYLLGNKLEQHVVADIEVH